MSTPGQNYLGCGFSAQGTKDLLDLAQDVHQKKERWVQVVKQGKESSEVTCLAHTDYTSAQGKLDDYVSYWAKLSVCYANCLAVILKVSSFFKQNNTVFYDICMIRSLSSYQITELGADNIAQASGLLGQTLFINAGDALATVDATTGLGCNTAIGTIKTFTKMCSWLKKSHPLADAVRWYAETSSRIIDHIHAESLRFRRMYRPDAVYALDLS